MGYREAAVAHWSCSTRQRWRTGDAREGSGGVLEQRITRSSRLLARLAAARCCCPPRGAQSASPFTPRTWARADHTSAAAPGRRAHVVARALVARSFGRHGPGPAVRGNHPPAGEAVSLVDPKVRHARRFQHPHIGQGQLALTFPKSCWSYSSAVACLFLSSYTRALVKL